MLALLFTALPPYRLTAQCPDGAPPPCRGARAIAAAASRVAVLPFENRARDTSLTLLAEGLADQITTNLGQVSRLELVPPASVRFVLVRTPREPARLGRALGSRWLVDGQLLSSAGHVRVSVQLIEAASQRVRWTGAFQRPAEDLFAVISAVADSVATAIIGTLAPAERERLARRPTTSNASMVAYTRGLAAFHRMDGLNARDAIVSFESATATDSMFAQAWAGLAEALIWLDSYVPARQVYPRARVAAERALAIDPMSPAALSALGAVTMYYDWDLPRAEPLVRRALRQDSTYARAWLYLAELLAAQGRFDDAVPAYHAALAADTLDEPVALEAANGLQLARRTDESLALIARWRARLPRSDVWAFAEALTLVGAHHCAASPPAAPIGPLSLACAGQAAAARALADSMVAQIERGDLYYYPAWMAMTFVGMGDHDAALRWLARGIEARTYILVFLRVDPIWDPLRGDPRFTELLQRMRPEGR